MSESQRLHKCCTQSLILPPGVSYLRFKTMVSDNGGFVSSVKLSTWVSPIMLFLTFLRWYVLWVMGSYQTATSFEVMNLCTLPSSKCKSTRGLCSKKDFDLPELTGVPQWGEKMHMMRDKLVVFMSSPFTALWELLRLFSAPWTVTQHSRKALHQFFDAQYSQVFSFWPPKTDRRHPLRQ